MSRTYSHRFIDHAAAERVACRRNALRLDTSVTYHGDGSATIYSAAPILQDGRIVGDVANVSADPRYCDVCRFGATGSCDERCEIRSDEAGA